MKALRNVAIIVVLAAAVFALPGGGSAAATVSAVLSVIFFACLGYFFGRMYLERRLDIYALGDRNRAALYGAIGIVAVTLTATPRLTATGSGTIAFVALLVTAALLLFSVYNAWRSY